MVVAMVAVRHTTALYVRGLVAARVGHLLLEKIVPPGKKGRVRRGREGRVGRKGGREGGVGRKVEVGRGE